MKVNILRCDKATCNEPYMQSFHVAITDDDRFTVMDLLEKIYNEQDSTLAFFSHSVCNHGICGRCAMKVNGKVKLACTTMVCGDEITLEPKSKKVVRDLVCL